MCFIGALKEVHSSLMPSLGNKILMMALKQHISYSGFLRQFSARISSNPSGSSSHRLSTLAWINTIPSNHHGPDISVRNKFMHVVPTQHCCRWRSGRSWSSTTLFANGDSKESDTMQVKRPLSTTGVNSESNKIDHEAEQWFTQSLPEGWCVGVVKEGSMQNTTTTMLHPDEYQWGQDNFASDVSRTSYYLGRTALRMAIKTLLESESESAINNNNGNDVSSSDNDYFYTQLFEQIQSTPIEKDYYGRPILPEIILGSISHKGEYAVGLARFRSSTWNGSNRVFRGLDNENIGNGLDALDANAIEWREECPILEEDQSLGAVESTDCTSIEPLVRGVGIDIERIGDKRAGRIAKKVLTQSEREELGRLEVRLEMHVFY